MCPRPKRAPSDSRLCASGRYGPKGKPGRRPLKHVCFRINAIPGGHRGLSTSESACDLSLGLLKSYTHMALLQLPCRDLRRLRSQARLFFGRALCWKRAGSCASSARRRRRARSRRRGSSRATWPASTSTWVRNARSVVTLNLLITWSISTSTST